MRSWQKHDHTFIDRPFRLGHRSRAAIKTPDANRFTMKQGERERTLRSHTSSNIKLNYFARAISLIFILTICRLGLTGTTDAASAHRESVDNRRFSRRRSNELVSSLGFITGTIVKCDSCRRDGSDFRRNRGRSSTNRRLTIYYTLHIHYDCFPVLRSRRTKCNA